MADRPDILPNSTAAIAATAFDFLVTTQSLAAKGEFARLTTQATLTDNKASLPDFANLSTKISGPDLNKSIV
jgi:hypothetical protein